MRHANPKLDWNSLFDEKRRVVWREICRFLQKYYIAEQSTILEIGARHCHFINQIKGAEKHALDISTDIVERVERGVIPHVRSCTAMLDLEDDYFDVVFMSNVFEHLTRRESVLALAEIKRVLKRNGILIAIQPNFKYCWREYFDDPTHIQIFTHLGVSELIRSSGLSVIDLKPRFLPFSMRSKLPKIPWLVTLYLHSPFKPFAGQMLIIAKK